MATSILTTTRSQRPTLVIRSTKGWAALNVHELWRYRDLLLIFIQRELKLLYKQTALGAVWVVLQPLLAAVIFAVIFGRVAKLPSDGAPYLLFVFCGLTVWTYFSQALQRAGNSLVQNSQLVSKVYFPRLLIPLARTLGPVVDFAVVFAVLLGLMTIYGYHPSGLRLAVVPGLLILMIFTATGVALFFAALSVRYRDCAYVLPYFIQIWMYASPVVYPVSLVPVRWRPWLALNPVVGFIESFRWAVLGHGVMNVKILLITIIMSVLTLLAGAFFFRRVERDFADII
jgi:lipopolysaccharide transport system permease protein